MRNSDALRPVSGPGLSKFSISTVRMPRTLLLGVILILALIAFEAFNFDTTRYALQNLMGDVRFAGFAWATILAIAFCAIDFAGLGRLLTPEKGADEPREIWYLTGAWLLGATMNAIMTWWAVSTVLLSHELGNEVLSREQLLHIVPVFVAVLVWLTRILFIGAVTLAGERLLHNDAKARSKAVDLSATGTSGKGHIQHAHATPTRKHIVPVELGASTAIQADSGAQSGRTRRPPRPGTATRPSGSYTSRRGSHLKT